MAQKRAYSALIIAVGAVAIVFIIGLYRPLWQPFERRIYDLKYQLTLDQVRNDRIVVVDIDEKSLEKLGRYQNWPRAYFARVISFLRNARVVGFDIFFAEPDTLPLQARQYYERPSFDSLMQAAIKESGNVVLVASLDSLHVREPIYTEHVHIGLGDVYADNDGVIRRGFATFSNYPTFAAQIAKAAGFNTLSNEFLVLFHSEASYRRISFSDIYLQRVPKEFFDDKIVLVGGTARGLFDYHAVPFDRHFPGVVLQAILVDNFIGNDKIHEISLIIAIVITLLLSIVFNYLACTKPVHLYSIVCSVAYVVFVIASFFLFSIHVDLGIVRPTYALFLGLLGSLIYRYQFVEREKRELKSIFSRYYSRELVEQVAVSPPKLGGEKVDCTILFADIRNFTPYAEKTDPESVGLKLNTFLDEMVRVIFDHQGRIDKFIGDCVMAVFGNPVRLDNHALHACQAALDMIAKADHLGFKIGIGINSGEVISGNFGSPMRMEYTVIGDAVNLASRLEGQTKEYKVSVVCSEEVYKRVKDTPETGLMFEELGMTRVKGKAAEIKVYSLKRT